MTRLVFFLAFLVAAAASAQDYDSQIEVVAALDVAPGNITHTPDGRTFISLHQFYEPEHAVAELLPGGELRQLPRTHTLPTSREVTLDAVLGLQADAEGTLWLLDNGGASPELFAYDTGKDRMMRVFPLPVVEGSFVNDLAVDIERRTVYIADPAGDLSALIVVDTRDGHARRVLQGHRSVVPEPIDMLIDGRMLRITRPDGSQALARIGVDPIALSADGDWLYFGPMTGRTLHRVPTVALRDRERTPYALANAVEVYAERPACDGISTDVEGNIYISDIEAHAIGVVDAERNYRRLVTDPRLSWPDAFSFGPDGWLHVVANQLHHSPPLNGGLDASTPPYLVLRMRPLASGVVGR